MQILRVEKRRLTIALMYGIITAEKEFLRSRIFDFLIAPIFHRNGLDHSFDHLPIRTTWKQCDEEHRKAPFSDTKAPKSPRNQEKNYHLTLRDVEVAGSHLPLEDRGACTPGEGCANLRLGRIPCHLDQKALGNTRFPRLFALPLTQLLGGCYAICYANTRNT